MTDSELYTALSTLTIFSELLEKPPLSGLYRLLAAYDAPVPERSRLFSLFARQVLDGGGDLGAELLMSALADYNPYTAFLVHGTGDAELLLPQLDAELEVLAAAALYNGEAVRCARGISNVAATVRWNCSVPDFAARYKREIQDYPRRGFGIFASGTHFLLADDGGLRTVRHPDPVRLADLVGYETERGKVAANTEAFLSGLPANNVLLYGDAGTGKSSTVKAVVNEYAGRGLRMAEIKKHQLFRLPELIDRLAASPLRFILFADDLTFSGDDRDFCSLKAILEGGVGGADNVLIYATSNHRHMIKENIAERESAVSVTDCIEEAVSLSARFGLTVTFSRPDRDLYLEIAAELARRSGIACDAEFSARAEAFALRRGGRTPRTALQFVDSLFAEKHTKNASGKSGM